MTPKIYGKIKYEFVTKMWQHTGQGSWHFVSLPHDLGKEIRDNFKLEEEGWGRLKAIAKIGNSLWETAIWSDSKHKTYLLPIKADIRRKEKLGADINIKTIVWI